MLSNCVDVALSCLETSAMKILLPLLSLLALLSFVGCATTDDAGNGKDINVEPSPGDLPKTSAVYLPGPY